MQKLNMMMPGKKRFLLKMIVICVCCAVLCLFLFVTVSADHECTHGDDCGVCRVIACCVRIISEICTAVVYTAAAAVTVTAASAFITGAFRKRCAVTPVTLRTELRD
ncbi:MAG: hypothetical protein K5876_03400 [Ruminiclostridium sp.]|nr:hypothetical protein [Ruminiclostridium sp.]